MTINGGGILAPGQQQRDADDQQQPDPDQRRVVELGIGRDQQKRSGDRDRSLDLGGLGASQITWSTNAGFGVGTYKLIVWTGNGTSSGLSLTDTNVTIDGLSGTLSLGTGADVGDLLLTVVVPEPVR